MLNVTTIFAALTLALTSFGLRHTEMKSAKPAPTDDGDSLTITSPSFKKGQMIPNKFTCKGGDVSPQLHIDGIPEGTKSVAVIMDDPDEMVDGGFTYWLAWNLDPTMVDIPEGYKGAVQGINMKKRKGYNGPCPKQGTHHFHFRVYALSARLKILETSDKNKLLNAMEGKILKAGDLVGIYTIKK